MLGQPTLLPADPVLFGIATRMLATSEQDVGRLASGAYGPEKQKQFLFELSVLAEGAKKRAMWVAQP